MAPTTHRLQQDMDFHLLVGKTPPHFMQDSAEVNSAAGRSQIWGSNLGSAPSWLAMLRQLI